MIYDSWNSENISIHAPREGGDTSRSPRLGRCGHFNPRPPRGGRPAICSFCRLALYFNPRPPRGGRHLWRHPHCGYREISIHAPREGGDEVLSRWLIAKSYFNPRPPRGGATYSLAVLAILSLDFNPRPPRGGRLSPSPLSFRLSQFQSTPPARGATKAMGISLDETFDFNPRPPRGGRPKKV